MVKYNYTGAAALWEKLYILCFNPWDFSDRQKERRFFMREITRGNIEETINHLWDSICFAAVPPVSEKTHKYINDLDVLISDLLKFKGVL